MRLSLPFLLLFFLGFSSSLKFLAYYPMFSSHTRFLGRLCDVLAEAGHNVTIVVADIDAYGSNVGARHDNVKVIHLPQSEAARALFEGGGHDISQSANWKTEDSMLVIRNLLRVSDAFTETCKVTLQQHKDLLEFLRSEKFDAAFTEPIDMCGAVIFEVAGIKRTAMTISFANAEGTFAWTGMPSFPSYVPGSVSARSDQMTFMERVMNTISLLVTVQVVPTLFNGYDKLIREEYGPGFPDLNTILRGASLYFVNADPLLDFPRPTIHKVIEIGGISISAGHNELNETWSALLDLRPKTVLISFGTVAKAYLMPEEYKQTIRETVRKFPQVTFIWKYEKPEHEISKGIDNLIETTWLPQNDFLYDRRLSLFITHGGQGSVTEATTAGVPLIVIPVLGDQRRNAQVIKRAGTGIVVEKDSLSDTNALESAIRTILKDSVYERKARFVGESIKNRPFSPSQVFVRNMEFLARYGPLRQLDHYGTQLNFFQYYLIDVFAFLGGIVLTLLFAFFFTVRLTLRFLYRIVRAKSKLE